MSGLPDCRSEADYLVLLAFSNRCFAAALGEEDLIRNMMLAALAASCVTCAPVRALAQDKYPSKPIRIFVGFPAGGSTDVLARAAANEARKILGQELIVINKPGATSTIAVTEVATSAPDGYTIGIAPSGVTTLTPYFINVRTDLLANTEALIVAGAQRTGLVVHADSPIKSVKELFGAMQANPGKISIGTPGAGTTGAIILRVILQENNFPGSMVPFQGDAPVMQALLGKHVNAAFMSAAGFSEMIRAGKMRLIASMENDRLENAPDVPTLKEQGFNYVAATLQYFMAPKGLPPAIRARLIDALTKATAMPSYVNLAKKSTLYGPSKLTGSELDAHFLKVRDENAILVKRLGVGRKK